MALADLIERASWAFAKEAQDTPLNGLMNQGALLRRGDHGLAVKELQRLLNRVREDRPKLVTDGRFGRRTEAALKAFQTARGTPDSGVLDLILYIELSSRSAEHLRGQRKTKKKTKAKKAHARTLRARPERPATRPRSQDRRDKRRTARVPWAFDKAPRSRRAPDAPESRARAGALDLGVPWISERADSDPTYPGLGAVRRMARAAGVDLPSLPCRLLFEDGALTHLQTQLALGRPVAAMVRRTRGERSFVLICGRGLSEDRTPYYLVLDPLDRRTRRGRRFIAAGSDGLEAREIEHRIECLLV